MFDGTLLTDEAFQRYINRVQSHILSKIGKPKKLSAVKVLVLQILWDAGNSFPREWVPSDLLYERTNQKYIDRRVRELRNESGCDIQTGMNRGVHAYRLLSDNLNEAFDRQYLTEKNKILLLERHNYCCAACGQRFPSNTKGLQSDHKIPLIRGGGSELDNWQPLCVACNVAKRRSCSGCEVDCTKCAWAFPEHFGQTIPIQLSTAVGYRLQALARLRNQTPQALITESVQRFVDENLPKSEL
jgi:5-methylcytosine-specific restriction endonuclease McrA